MVTQTYSEIIVGKKICSVVSIDYRAVNDLVTKQYYIAYMSQS